MHYRYAKPPPVTKQYCFASLIAREVTPCNWDEVTPCNWDAAHCQLRALKRRTDFTVTELWESDQWLCFYPCMCTAVPYLVAPLQSVDTLEDANVTYRCMAGGVPEPTVTWYSNGQLLAGLSLWFAFYITYTHCLLILNGDRLTVTVDVDLLVVYHCC